MDRRRHLARAPPRPFGDEAIAEVESQGVARADIALHVRAQLRYAGSDTALEVKSASAEAMRREFEIAHKARFGFIEPANDLVIEATDGVRSQPTPIAHIEARIDQLKRQERG